MGRRIGERECGILETQLFNASLKLHVDTFRGDLQLSALGDLDLLNGLVARGGRGVLDLLDDVVSLEDLAEDDVPSIEPAIGCR